MILQEEVEFITQLQRVHRDSEYSHTNQRYRRILEALRYVQREVKYKVGTQVTTKNKYRYGGAGYMCVHPGTPLEVVATRTDMSKTKGLSWFYLCQLKVGGGTFSLVCKEEEIILLDSYHRRVKKSLAEDTRQLQLPGV